MIMRKLFLLVMALFLWTTGSWEQTAVQSPASQKLKNHMLTTNQRTERPNTGRSMTRGMSGQVPATSQETPKAPGAWVTQWNFAQTSGTYTAVSGGTILGTTTNDENVFGPYSIGFNFTYNGTVYTQFSVATNGFIGLGSTVVTTASTPISTGASNNIISALGVNLAGQTGSDLQYLVTGSSPNRTLVVQWTNYRKTGATGDVFNFQIRLNETANSIVIVYNNFTVNTNNSLPEVGVRGASNADFNNRKVDATNTTWAASGAGTANSSNCRLRTAVKPANGQTYTWMPPVNTFPYAEDFSATLNPYWSIAQVAGTGLWTMATSINYPELVPVYTLNPQSGSYLAKFDSYNFASGTSSRLQAVTFDFTALSSPSVEFYMSQDAEFTNLDKVEIQVSTNGGTTWTTLAPAFYRYNTNFTTPGWKKYTAYLAAYANTNNVTLAFLGTSLYGNMLAIDNVVVKQGITDDVGTAGIWAPTKLPPGQAYPWWSFNRNYGPNTETFNVDTKLRVNTTPVVTVTNTITALTFNSTTTLSGTFPVTSYASGSSFDILNQTKLLIDQNTSNDILINSTRPCTKDTIYAWDDGVAEGSIGYNTGTGWLGQLYYLSVQDTLTSISINWGTIPGALAGNSLEIFNVAGGVPTTKFSDIVTGISLATTDQGIWKTYKPAVPIILPAGTYWIGAHQSVALAGTYLVSNDETGISADNFLPGFAFYSSTATAWTDYITSGFYAVNMIRPNFSTYGEVIVQNPQNFNANAVSPTEIDLTWNLNSAGNPVMLVRNTTNTFGTPAVGTSYANGSTFPGGGTVLYNGTLLSFNDTPLTPYTAYYYKIWSKDATLHYSSGDTKYDITPCYTSAAPFTENFEGTTFPPSCWLFTTGTGNWIRSALASGYGSGAASAEANFYSIPAGNSFDLLTLPFDAGSMTSPVLKFDYAYATYATEVDQMDVYYSTNGGNTYTLLLNMPGGVSGILNTGGVVGNLTQFVPTASQWASQTLSLPAGTNLVKFTATSAFGNNLYLDNVRVYQIYAHDVATNSIDIAQAVTVGSVIPKATVINPGQNTETFTVTMTTTGYSSTKSVTALASNASVQVTFDPWTTALGDYSVTVCTSLTTPVADMYNGNNCLTQAVKVLNLNKTVYGYNAYANTGTDPEGPTTFSLSAPGTLNSLANQSTELFVAGGTWANGTWYGVVYDTIAPYNFITINPATGARTVIGDMGTDMTGLSYNTANSTMYAVSFDASNSQLYTINMLTGQPTAVGSPIAGRLLINLAINNAGACYSLDLNAGVIGSVDLATGAFTPVGTGIGFDASYAQDMEFDRDNGNLFIAAQDLTSGWLAWVNTATGTTLKIGDFEGGAEITGFAIPYTPAPSFKTLVVKAFLEGKYDAINNHMNKAQDCLDGENAFDKWPANQVDTLSVYLVTDLGVWPDPIPYDYQGHAKFIGMNGTITISDLPASLGGNYYIILRHRQSVETWSAAPVSFAGSSIAYDFTTAASQAYGNDQKKLSPESEVYGLWGGDVQGGTGQDGYVDIQDNNYVFNGSQNAEYGYILTDLTGTTFTGETGQDGFVDIQDMALTFNNMQNSVGMNTPQYPMKKATRLNTRPGRR
jgi:hypothetical protein